MYSQIWVTVPDEILAEFRFHPAMPVEEISRANAVSLRFTICFINRELNTRPAGKFRRSKFLFVIASTRSLHARVRVRSQPPACTAGFWLWLRMALQPLLHHHRYPR
jgi:hypothetical protein